MEICSYPSEEKISISFSYLPEDVQLCILSFLNPSDLAAVSCTSKRFISLCNADSKLWYAMCERRWGSKTQIEKWANGKINFKLLYETLSEYEDLIGFWRRSGGATGLPLVFFEWGASCVTGSRVSPAINGSYHVLKSPFIWMSLTDQGEALNYLDPDNRTGSLLESPDLLEKSLDLIQVNVSFTGKGHVVIEASDSGSPELRRDRGNVYRKNGSTMNFDGEEYNGGSEMENVIGGAEIGSPPDRFMSEMYQYFANRRSPGAGGERAWRKQRRREKERQGRRRTWEPEHFVKIANCSPTRSRPLQGLWKGLCDDTTLHFYHVTYDESRSISCRRVGNPSSPCTNLTPIFSALNPTFINCPLSPEEDYLYNTRVHIRPSSETITNTHEHLSFLEDESVTRIMFIISSLGSVSNRRRSVEGRIWQYIDGTFGFGFLRDNFIVDLKHIAQNGHILDTTEFNGA